MSLNSLKFFLFLPLVYALFYSVSQKRRLAILLGASFIFYASLGASYLLVVLVMVAGVTFVSGERIHSTRSPGLRLLWLWTGIGANLLILAMLKIVPALLQGLKIDSPLFVTVGISFYVFQAISYLADIYLELEKPEPDFCFFLLYLSFFPKLLQGPIERAGHLLPQLKKRYQFDYGNMRSGLLQFTRGLFKKVVVADRLGIFVDYVYSDLHAFTGVPLLMATYTYAFQIYLDFSGYTDMALGTARLFNIELTENFNSPYLATSVADFWRRWHITFSRWLLDYVFAPLQMQWRDWRTAGTAAALMVTFLISGLWHGAKWGFLVWGALHGAYLACAVFYRPHQKKLHKALGIEKSRLLRVWQIFFTFNLVTFAWIFFRAANLRDAAYVVTHLFRSTTAKALAFHEQDLKIVIIGCCGLVASRMVREKWGETTPPLLLRWIVYVAMVLSVVGLGIFEETTFIYNKF